MRWKQRQPPNTPQPKMSKKPMSSAIIARRAVGFHASHPGFPNSNENMGSEKVGTIKLECKIHTSWLSYLGPNIFDLDKYIKSKNAKKVRPGFSYASNTNDNWETPESLREKIEKL